MLQEKTEAEYNDRIVKLAKKCPLYLDNPHCPLKNVRGRELKSKVKWFNSLSLSTKKTIYHYHVQCYAKNTDEDLNNRKKSNCERKEIAVSDDTKDLAICNHDFFCLNGQEDALCKVTACLFDSILYIACHNTKCCDHQYAVGEDLFCSCPVRKEIYQKYGI